MVLVGTRMFVQSLSLRARTATLLAPLEPVASVYCTLAAADQVSAAQDREARWRLLANQLRGEGADEGLVAALGTRVLRAPVAPATVAVFAPRGGGVEEFLLHGLLLDHAGYSTPADVLPVLRWRQGHPACVVAVADRTGGELTVLAAGGAAARTRTVTGPDDEVAVRSAGGRANLSHNRFERRARDSWRHNAAAVAKAIVAEASSIDAETVLVTGEDHVVHELIDQLPADPGWTVRRVPGRHAADHAQRAVWVAAELSAAAHERDLAIATAVRESSGPAGRAVQGWADTVAALAEDRVALLVVADLPTDLAADRPEVWFGPGGRDVFLDPAMAEASALPLRHTSGVAPAVRSALMSGGWVRVVGADLAPAEGIGALCR